MADVAYLECTRCGLHLDPAQPRTVCPKDGGVLYARYNLGLIKQSFTKDSLRGRVPTMWRYADVLPEAKPVTLGEGLTPLLLSRESANLYIKDEGLNPTASFEARGISAAVTVARAYGLRKLAAASAGNAASALAAYAAAARIEAHIFMPRDAPIANRIECEVFGAHVTLVDGLVSDCARIVSEREQQEGWFDVSTLKEPFQVEGQKTMGYEVAEQLDWRLPQGIVFPPGGGVGLLGMWKAFDEMEQLGWIGPERPRMVRVQSSGCAPVVKAFAEGRSGVELLEAALTNASDLRVPEPFGSYLVLDILKQSHGAALAVTETQMVEAVKHWGQAQGIFAAPEGGATLVAYRELLRDGFFSSDDTVVTFNTGSGLKHLENFAQEIRRPPAGRQIAGIIGPY